MHAQSARHAFSISQGSREREGWVEQHRGAEIVRKDGRKTQRGRVVPALVHRVVGSACVLRWELSYCAERPLSVRITVIHVVRGRLHIGKGLFARVFVRIAGFVDTVGTRTRRWPAMAHLRILKLLGWLQIRFFHWARGHDGRGVVYGKSRLHALNGAWARILAGLAVPFLFLGEQTDLVRGLVALEARGLQLLDAPATQ